MIAIIDYRAGNIKSVENAFNSIDQKTIVTNKENDIKNSSAIVIPGVGAFGYAIQSLRDLNLIDVLNEQILIKKKPYLGICLGLQFLADVGYENGRFAGLGWISGTVDKLKRLNENHRIPHIGWNNVEIKLKDPLFEGIDDNTDFYFVHSYVLKCDENIVSSICIHGYRFVASIHKDNIFAVQFHPEKSQKAGLKLLKNFCKVI